MNRHLKSFAVGGALGAGAGLVATTILAEVDSLYSSKVEACISVLPAKDTKVNDLPEECEDLASLMTRTIHVTYLQGTNPTLSETTEYVVPEAQDLTNKARLKGDEAERLSKRMKVVMPIGTGVLGGILGLLTFSFPENKKKKTKSEE
jgi:hypothetical protein